MKIQVSLRTIMNVRVAACDVKCFPVPPEALTAWFKVGVEDSLVRLPEVSNSGKNPHAWRSKKTQSWRGRHRADLASRAGKKSGRAEVVSN
jgi:hypothetical protein